MLDRIVVINSTPIIALASIDCIHLLKELYNKVYIPKSVRDEVFAKQGSKAQTGIVLAEEWMQIKQIGNVES